MLKQGGCFQGKKLAHRPQHWQRGLALCAGMQRFTENRLFLCYGFSGGVVKAVKALSQDVQTVRSGIFSTVAAAHAVRRGKKHLILLADIQQDLPADVTRIDALREGNLFANGQVILILAACVFQA